MALITKRQVADRLGLHPSSVQRMMDRGELRSAKAIHADNGKVIAHLFRPSDVDRVAKRRAA